MTEEQAPTTGRETGKLPGWIVGIGIALLAVVVGYFALGMPGMDHSPADAEADPAGEEHDMGDMGGE